MSETDGLPNLTSASSGAEQVQIEGGGIPSTLAAALAEHGIVSDSTGSGDFSWALVDSNPSVAQPDGRKPDASHVSSGEVQHVDVDPLSVKAITGNSGSTETSKVAQPAEEEEEEEDDIDIDADGLRSVESCLTFIFIDHEGDSSQRLCQLCR
jgi:hypothetical protein